VPQRPSARLRAGIVGRSSEWRVPGCAPNSDSIRSLTGRPCSSSIAIQGIPFQVPSAISRTIPGCDIRPSAAISRRRLAASAPPGDLTVFSAARAPSRASWPRRTIPMPPSAMDPITL
jgi:hypothetical protein